MEYTSEMNLISPSGYSMPFTLDKGEQVKVTLDYGEQTHPKTGEQFFHHGLDLETDYYPLRALASGVVTGVNRDALHGTSLTIHYSNNGGSSPKGYDVTYSHLAEVKVNCGKTVVASEVVALSGSLLHLEVSYDGQEIDPKMMLSMLYGNIVTLEQQGAENPVATMDMETHTKYDKDEPELSQLFKRYMKSYLKDVVTGDYQVPKSTEDSLRNGLEQGFRDRLFFDSMPSLLNPLGLGSRAIMLIQLIQEILIGDFLSYMGLKHRVFLSSMSEAEKKNLLNT